ncbi:MAG: NAD(P)-dependent oxidoreductase [Sedimentisphaerales bacterium]|nr:NAD(P)-dependent oxidoreductase [Sedimentisphaerales bacterium]
MKNTSILNEHDLEDLLSEPSEATTKVLDAIDGDIVVLGAGGKMGPTLAMMLKKASPDKNVYAVSRFSDKSVKHRIEKTNVETIKADLLNESNYEKLPKAENVFFMVGMKFGATGNQPLTWAMNSYVPSLVARHYKDSRIVALSTGNVYPFVDKSSNGPTENTLPDPIGEYAQSCLGRERMFEYFSQIYKTPVTLIRLNYANEPRYGIIVDLATKILNGVPIDLTMGAVNLIWQKDANDYIIRSITLADSPPTILNVTGSDVISVRHLAKQIAGILEKEPKFISQEADTALLSDASRCIETLGPPETSLDQMISMIVTWVASGKKTLNKPTKYDMRDGKF